MTARITSGQRKQIIRFAEDGLANVELTKEGAQRVIAQGGIFQVRLKALAIELASEYFTLLSDAKARSWLLKRAGKSEAEATRIINGYRRGAREHGIADKGSCHIMVAPGATLKATIPTLGPCWEDFRYLQGWNFPDPPTEECLFSFIPALLCNSTNKNMDEQRALLAKVRQHLELPENHLADLGSVTHLAGVALAYYKENKHDIFSSKIARTETSDSDGSRLGLRWSDGRLVCDYWFWVSERGGGSVGVLACGVEKALGS